MSFIARPKSDRGFRPALVALEGRALMSVSPSRLHHVAGVVHAAATTRANATITPITSPTGSSQAGGYRFLNFDGPGAGTNANTGTNINGIANDGVTVGLTIGNTPGNNNFLARPRSNRFATTTNIAGAAGASAFGVNNSGTVVGSDGINSAFTLSRGTVRTFLPNGASAATAFGINDRGVIVGQETAGQVTTGFLRVPGRNARTPAQDILVTGPGGLILVNVQGINNQGLAVGFYSNGSTTHGLIANQRSALNGTITSTAVADPTIPAVAGESGATFVFSQILGVNDRGIAVGYYGDSTGSQHGFLYNTKTAQYSFLDDPNVAFNNGVEVTQITGITNSGELTGFYSDATGAFHGFVAYR